MTTTILATRNAEWGFCGTIRHFADDVADALARGATLKDAIDAVVARWMGWTIARRSEREMGIPRGLPYLTGFVTHCEIEAEAFG